jgi:hypothetical protein
MSRKDYVEAARILRDTPMPATTRALLVARFVTMFADDNPRFSPSRFREASTPDIEPDTVAAITEAQRETFEAIRDPEYRNLALVSTALDGNPTAAIAAINRDGDEYLISPLAVLITDAVFDRMSDPATGL